MTSLWSPFAEEYLRDPYKMYKRLRAEAPVYRAQTDEFIVSRYEDVRAILKSADFKSGNRFDWLKRGIDYFSRQDQDLSHIYQAINTFILFLNPPDHVGIRNFVMREWNDREVDELIRTTADDLLAPLAGSFDFMERFAQPLPATVISQILGIPPSDATELRQIGVTMVRSLDLYHTLKELVLLNEASRYFVEYFRGVVLNKRACSDQSLAGRLVQASDRGQILSDAQLISLLIFLFIAGEETTAASIGTGVYHLAQRPDLYGRLRTDRYLLEASGVDELLRFDTPVQFLGRIAAKPTQVAGVDIPAGSSLTLLLASANRDEHVFEAPDELKLDRSPNPHLTFGYGAHYCLGEWLGKSQTLIAIDAVLRKFNSIKIQEKQEIKWNKNLSVRTLTSLLVTTT